MIKALTSLAAVVVLGACSSTDIAAPINHDRDIRAQVQVVRMAHDISLAGAGEAMLSDDAAKSLVAFLVESEARYGDRFFLDPGDNVSVSELAMVRELFAVRALPVGDNAPLGAKPGPRTVRLYLERHVVTAPTCGQWDEELGNSIRNNTSAFFGCSNAQSLALMVADPRDLVAGVDSPRSTAPAVQAILRGRMRAETSSDVGATGIELPQLSGASRNR